MDYVDCVNMYVYIYYICLAEYKALLQTYPALLPIANESRFLRNKFLGKLLNNFVTSL